MPAQHAVPQDQAHLPRSERQFPFRWINEREHQEVLREADQILLALKPATVLLLRVFGPPYLTREDREDFTQLMLLHCWKALARYDAWRLPKAKPTTFLNTNIRYAIRLIARDWKWPKIDIRRMTRIISDEEISGAPELDDVRLDHLITDIMQNPSVLGSHAKELLTAPYDVLEMDIAKAIGCKPQSLSMPRNAIAIVL